jgi:hypothetical protein
MSSLIFRRSLQQQHLLRGVGPAASRISHFSSSTDKDFEYQELFDLAPDTTTPYRKLTGDHVSTFEANGIKFLKVEPEALRLLTATAMVCFQTSDCNSFF